MRPFDWDVDDPPHRPAIRRDPASRKADRRETLICLAYALVVIGILVAIGIWMDQHTTPPAGYHAPPHAVRYELQDDELRTT